MSKKYRKTSLVVPDHPHHQAGDYVLGAAHPPHEAWHCVLGAERNANSSHFKPLRQVAISEPDCDNYV